jgi:geranylgeranyl reductase family protein
MAQQDPATRARPKPSGKTARPRGRSTFDVIVVGGGPAGSVMAWELVRHGVAVLLLDGARFPREKVCGDYVEPRGLRVLDRMGCLKTLERGAPLPISHSATYLSGERVYNGPIPYYGLRKDMPSCGYIIPRETLDHLLLQTAVRAGASVHEEAHVILARAKAKGVEVEVRQGRSQRVFRAAVVVGADGVNSVVGRSAGVLVSDPRYIAVAQRAYAEGIEKDQGEAAIFFDEDLSPGYGWAFPMAGGKVNLGVGILAETRERLGISVPQLFRGFVAKLRRTHPRFRKLRLCRHPIGGIVKTYGGAGPNHFPGGVLIGDAGSFVDPMTGEGITPAMESAVIAARVVRQALAAGRFDQRTLSAYEREFRAYFDPAMIFLDFCAATMRNRHMSGSCLKALARGYRKAQQDADFARTAGACFGGGVDVDPRGVLWQISARIASELGALTPWRTGEARVDRSPWPSIVAEWIGWQSDWWRSVAADPSWHTGWAMDVQKKFLRVLSTLGSMSGDPRARGIL